MIGILLSLKPFQEICMYAKITSMFDNRKNSTEQTLSFDFLNPSKFFLKEHGYSLPHTDVLAYTMCQGVGSGTGEQVPPLLLQLKTLPNKYNCGISSFIYYNCVLSFYLHKNNK